MNILNSIREFFAALARGLTPIYASLLALLGLVFVAVLILMAFEIKRLKGPRKTSRRILRRLGKPL